MPETTKTLDETLEFFLNNLTTSKWDALLDRFADNAVIEFPFAPPNRPQKVAGKQEIVSYFAALKKVIRLDEVHLVAMHKTTDPNVVIFQGEGKGRAVLTGRAIEPKYIGVLTVHDGLMVRYQDYNNPLIGISALGGTILFPGAEG